jgi:hypothetical protein
MRHCFTHALQGRQRVLLDLALLLLASPEVAAGTIASCTDGPPPSYGVPATNLPLIPEQKQSTFEPAGGSLYVLPELRVPEGRATRISAREEHAEPSSGRALDSLDALDRSAAGTFRAWRTEESNDSVVEYPCARRAVRQRRAAEGWGA